MASENTVFYEKLAEAVRNYACLTTGGKNRVHVMQVPLAVPYKALEKFPKVCMGQREVPAVHDFSFLS